MNEWQIQDAQHPNNRNARKGTEQSEKKKLFIKITQGSCPELKNIGFQMERSHYIGTLHTTYTWRHVNLKFENTGLYLTNFHSSKWIGDSAVITAENWKLGAVWTDGRKHSEEFLQTSIFWVSCSCP